MRHNTCKHGNRRTGLTQPGKTTKQADNADRWSSTGNYRALRQRATYPFNALFHAKTGQFPAFVVIGISLWQQPVIGR